MKIDTSYGRDLDDSMLEQLQYMEADAYAYYESIDSDEDWFIVGAIPSESFKQFKRRTANIFFLMKTKKSKLIGMACLSKMKKSTMCLHTVFVKAPFRRKGIGEALVRRAAKEAKKQNCIVSLGVNPLNCSAISLYKKLGFKVCKGQKLEMQLSSN